MSALIFERQNYWIMIGTEDHDNRGTIVKTVELLYNYR
jgi:hypothetical protein